MHTTFGIHADADRLHTRGKAANVQRLSKQIGVWRDQKPGIERNGFGLAKGNTACYDSYRRYLINPDADRPTNVR